MSDDSVFDPEPNVSGLGGDDEPYDVPDVDPADEEHELPLCGEDPS